MNSDIVLQGELAKDRLLEHFRELQIKQSHFAEKERSENYLLYDERSGLMQIRLGDDRGVATIDSVYLMNNGDQMAKGFGFVFERQDSPGKHTHNWKIPKKTNLDILVETQVAQDFEVLQPLPPGITSAAYDLPSLITHDPDFHKVNFTWIEAIFNVAIESRLGYTAGARLMDNLHMLYQDEEIQRILFIGERARGYSAIADTSRLNVPWTCSRPEEQKMMKDVIVIDTFSEYNPDVPKRHQIMRAFMDRCQGKRTLVVDDLGATLNTMGPFLDVVKQYGGIPQGCTLIDLGYIPDAARVHLDFPRKSIFTEEKPSVVRFSPEFMRTVYSK